MSLANRFKWLDSGAESTIAQSKEFCLTSGNTQILKMIPPLEKTTGDGNQQMNLICRAIYFFTTRK
jgi:hypothetical protein